MNEFPPDMNRDELDEQIRAALQVEALPQQLARLETTWHRRSRAQRRRRVAAACVLAAGLLVAVTASLSFLGSAAPRGRIAIDGPPRRVAPVVPETAPVAKPPAPEPLPEEEPPRIAARAPTTYERIVFVAKSHRAAKRPSAAVTVAGLIEHLTLEPVTDVEQLVEASDFDPMAVERQLVRRLARANHEEVPAILQLLAVYGAPRSAPQVLRLAHCVEFRDEALETLERIVGVTGLADMAAQSSDRPVRAAILRRLLTGSGEDGLSAYLVATRDSALSAEAIAVADELSESLVARLFHRLDDKDEDQDVRLAAALVLGRSSGPGVAEGLIRRATATESRTGSREAWIALFACRDERATKFLTYAGRQPKLLGSFNRAYMWWQART